MATPDDAARSRSTTTATARMRAAAAEEPAQHVLAEVVGAEAGRRRAGCELNGGATNSPGACGATSGPRMAIATRMSTKTRPIRVRHSRSDRRSSDAPVPAGATRAPPPCLPPPGPPGPVPAVGVSRSQPGPQSRRDEDRRDVGQQVEHDVDGRR